MEERIPPDEPDAVDQDSYREPDERDPHPRREPGDEEMMRFPGEDAPDVVGGGQDAAEGPGEERGAPDATGSSHDPV